MPVEGIVAVNFTGSQTSPGVLAISVNGSGNLAHVGNLSFQLQKTIDLTATYSAVTSGPDAGGYGIFSGQITVTGGTGRFQGASGIVPFSAVAGPGQAAYSFKGFLPM